jgi:Na+-transporting methylmalonyl-CoA/oxaloacetate decarboxylase gamma subunit
VLTFFVVRISAAEYPQFSDYWDNNGTQIGTGTGYVNVTVTSTNGSVILQVMGLNFIASNSSGDSTRFNVTVELVPAGNYAYNWISYGNGTDALYNISDTRSYTVNATPDTTPPYFTNLANQVLSQGQYLNYDIDATDVGVGLGTFAINWTDTFAIVSSTGVLTNVSALSAGDYYINVSVNDTSGNLNSTIMLVNVVADTTRPAVSLVSPSDGSLRALSPTVIFTYSVTDNSNIATCSLIINGVIDQSNSSAIIKGTDEIFTKSLSNGNYDWSVNCTDAANNQGHSLTYFLIVNYTAFSNPSGGEEILTDLTNITEYIPSNNSENLTGFRKTISSWVNKLGELINNVAKKVSPYLKPVLEVSKPDLLWIFTGIGIIILVLIILWRLGIILKKVKFKKFIRKEEKPKKENKEIKKKTIEFPIEKNIIKPDKEAQSKLIDEGINKAAFNLPTERKPIKPNKIIQRKYSGEKGEEYLRKRIRDIERKQRMRVLDEIKKQSKNLSK